MSASRDFSKWATEVLSDPHYPAGLPKDEETVAIYVMVAEAIAEAAAQQQVQPGQAILPWIPTAQAAPHSVN